MRGHACLFARLLEGASLFIINHFKMEMPLIIVGRVSLPSNHWTLAVKRLLFARRSFVLTRPVREQLEDGTSGPARSGPDYCRSLDDFQEWCAIRSHA